MKYLFLLIVLLFIMWNNNISAQSSQIDKNIRILQKGADYFEEKEYFKAEEEFLKIKKIGSQSDDINKSIKFLYNLWLGKTNYELNKFNYAKNYLDSAFLICKTIYSTKDEIYLNCVEWLINTNLKLGNNVQSIELLLQKRGLLTELNKELSSEFANNETTLGDCYNEKEDFVNSEKFYKNSILVFEKIHEIENDDYSSALHNLAAVYGKLANYKMAINYFLEAEAVLKKIRGKDNSDYCYLLINLADEYSVSNNFIKADSLYKEAIEILKKIVGQKHSDYFMALNHYANNFLANNDYQKADSIYQITLSKIKESLGDENSDYLTALKGLGVIYTTIGNYKEAKKIMNQALLLSKKIFSEDNYRYAQVLLSLGRIYNFEQNYFKADSLFNITLQIYEKTLGNKHPAYGNLLGNLADISIQFGEYSKAEKIINKELEIYNLCDLKRSYASALSSLGYLLIHEKKFNTAEEKLLEAKTIQSKILGENNLEYSTTLLFLSQLYHKMGKYEEAAKLIKYSAEIRLNIFGENNINYGGALNGLSIENFFLGKYELAISEERKSIEILENVIGNENTGLVSSLLNLSKYYIYDKNFDSAIVILNRSNLLLNNQFSTQFFTLTNSEQQKLLYTISPKVEFISSCFYLLQKDRSSTAGLYYNNELKFKGIILRNSEAFERLIKKSGDQILIEGFDSLRILKNQIQKLKINPTSKQNYNLTQLELIAENKEKNIIRVLSKDVQININKFNTNWTDVQKKLTIKDAAIEFVHFNYRNLYNADSIIYGALILRPGFKEPKFVYLFEQKQLELILQKQQNVSDSSYFNKLYKYEDIGKNLQELIWKPIDSLLNGVKIIYAAPSGLLYNINLSALPLNTNINVGEKYNLHILGTTSDIITHEELYISASSVQKAWLFGGIDYDNIIVTRPEFRPSNEYNYILSKKSNIRSGTEKWNYLLNTLYEASSIDTLCKNNNIATLFVSGKLASKTAFKNISGESKPFILHLATHGYFFPDLKTEKENINFMQLSSKQNVFKLSDNPLLRSGLIFSGANKSWATTNYNSDSTDDGILTALEVSNLDLSEAKLVVMSACETGLGEIKGSEGVFGLQRAFKLAGAKNIIMSLWKVPDEQTKELMKLFYKYLFNGLSVSEALRVTQLEMGKKYPPYYWAAFKLLE